MKVSARSAGGQVCILHLARFSNFLGIKIAGIEPAVPQIRKIDAIWVGSELGCAETLEACAEKVGFCNDGTGVRQLRHVALTPSCSGYRIRRQANGDSQPAPQQDKSPICFNRKGLVFFDGGWAMMHRGKSSPIFVKSLPK